MIDWLTNRVDLVSHPYWYLDILAISITLYYVLKYIRGSRAYQITIGLFVIILMYGFARVLELKAVIWIMQYLFAGMVIAIPIVYQDEMRRGLEKLGQMRLRGSRPKGVSTKAIEAISEACRIMAAKKIGALIVLKKQTSLRDFIETGAALNAEVSKALLLNIFTPNAPLHDGAVIIEDSKILAAGTVLPLSQQTFDLQLGTRHKSALGLSEQTDAIVIVVSEERGIISLAQDGSLMPQLSIDNLKQELSNRLYGTRKKTNNRRKKRRDTASSLKRASL